MKATEALIAWSPVQPAEWNLRRSATEGQVKIGPLLRDGMADWTRPYDFTGGAAYTYWRKLDGWQAIAMVFIEFNTLVVRDGIDPTVAHEAFLAIDEYRQRISPDMKGAKDAAGNPATGLGGAL
jgi:hypothetical protein